MKNYTQRLLFLLLLTLITLSLLAGCGSSGGDSAQDGQDPSTFHADLTYEGADSCLPCHDEEAEDMFASLHYQWEGEAFYMMSGPAIQGKISGAVNTYCGHILGNWNGCSACHVGLGNSPEVLSTADQLENIDCLICHQQEYKRIKVDGLMEPDTSSMTISMDTAVQRVHRPNRVTCLNCHATAGGGDAVKRGDLALASGNTTDRDFDIHMATTGADLSCQSCHHVESHRIAGRGSDLRATDLNIPVACSDCHGGSPHSNSTINQHISAVACQTCHIPIYAKDAADSSATEATEIERNWQAGSAHTSYPFHPIMTLENNQKPVYRFWNGHNENYLLGDAAVLDAQTGAYQTSRPDGDINDGKIYPFKYKISDYPLRTTSNELIALDTSVFFATADADAAVKAGLLNMGYADTDDYQWVTIDTYQALNHQVGDEDQALSCTDCHLATLQIDLQGELGYAPTGPTDSCIPCHENSTDHLEWSYGNWEDFREYHDEHVEEEEISCASCHGFSR
jgi:hypothetical protein